MKIPSSFSIEELDWSNLETTAKKLGYESRNQLIQALVKKVLYGDEVKTESTIQEQIEETKLATLILKYEILSQDLRIKTSFADYVEKYVKAFGTVPSYRGMRALGSKAKTDNQPKQLQSKETYNPKFTYTKTYSEWFGMCKICNESDFSASNEDFIISKLEDHIKEIHKQEPYEVVMIN